MPSSVPSGQPTQTRTALEGGAEAAEGGAEAVGEGQGGHPDPNPDPDPGEESDPNELAEMFAEMRRESVPEAL